ncbi:MAG TPA: hypothetical protein VF808_18520 [Ktedonobacterales bacterium]
MRVYPQSRILRALAAGGALALAALLTACGSATASPGAQATATCPPAPSFTSVTGAVTALGSGTVTVKDLAGASVTVALASTTRYSLTTTVAPSSLTAGMSVVVITDTNATVARSVRVLSTNGTGGGGGFGAGGFGGPRGTPGAGSNAACAGRFNGGAGAANGTNGFQGLRGTVDSATATTLTFDDAQGQTYSVALTSATVITKTAAGQAGDLKVGANVTILAGKTNGQLEARTVTIQS